VDVWAEEGAAVLSVRALRCGRAPRLSRLTLLTLLLALLTVRPLLGKRGGRAACPRQGSGV
jgi:hypothetical protein